MSSQQGPSNQRSGHGHRVKEHLSLDTRLAARAILEEEELGETVRQPMASNEADSQDADQVYKGELRDLHGDKLYGAQRVR